MSEINARTGGPDMLVAALWWARRGVPVFPLYEAVGLGCACGSQDCRVDADGVSHGSPGKHPRVARGLLDATTDEEAIRDWWKRWPTAAIGGVIGHIGVFVLDIDADKGGFESLAKWEEEHGTLPSTFTVRTGGGGEHRWFKVPQGMKFKNRTGVREGLDVRAERGYVVLPPSPHVSGRTYELVDAKASYTEPPEALVKLITERSITAQHVPFRAPTGDLAPLSDYRKRVMDYARAEAKRYYSLTEGQRNESINKSLYTLGGYLAFYGMTTEDVAHLFVDPVLHADQKVSMIPSSVTAGMAAPLPIPEREDRRPMLNRSVLDRVSRPKAKAPEDADTVPDDGGEPEEPPEDDSVGIDTLAALPLTDLGNAKRMALIVGMDLHWCEERHLWLVWNGLHWDWDEARIAHSWAQGVIENLGFEADYDREQLDRAVAEKADAEVIEKLEARTKAAYAHAKASQATGRIQAAMNECRALTGIPLTTKRLDANPMILTTQNGTLDIESGHFRAARRDDLGTRALTVSYDRDATAPTWEKVLERILPDEDVRGLVQRAFGYSLTGDNGEQRWFLLTGEGSNGKSTILDAFRTLMGPYATVLPAKVLEVQKFEQHPAELMGLLGARLAIGSEPRKSAKWDAERIKALTGDATISARRMRENLVEFACTAKLFVGANDLPRTDDLGHGFWRRLVVIPFTVTITQEEADPKLQSKLLAERAGILNWALDGAREWMRDGLSVPAACLAKSQEYRQEQDDVSRFLDEMCERIPGTSVAGRELYAAYRGWHAEEGLDGKPVHRIVFGKRLKALGYPAFEAGLRHTRHSGLTLRETGQAIAFQRTTRTHDDD